MLANPQKKRALLSVFDKTSIIEFAEQLCALDFEIVSTGGTSAHLHAADVPVTKVEALTGMPELLSGRVKTLHPAIHAGILARLPCDQAVLEQHAIAPIELVIVNLYPFTTVCSNPETSLADAIENIDIGGPTLIRAAAKNYQRVVIIVDPDDYPRVIDELKQYAMVSDATRAWLARKAFTHTAQYDQAICQDLPKKMSPDHDASAPYPPIWQQLSNLRYGENPHQQGFVATYHSSHPTLANTQPWQGKAMSYNNLLDAQAALTGIATFDEPACVIVKHGTPCGLATANNIENAFQKAWACDPTSAFGGIIAINRAMSKTLASQLITQPLIEVLIAPSFDEKAKAMLQKKPNIRCLSCSANATTHWDYRSIDGGMLIQQQDTSISDPCSWQTVTEHQPNDAVRSDLIFAWEAVRSVKSNAIVIASDKATIGIGAGQTSRIDSVHLALHHAKQHASTSTPWVLASDAFFPFDDIITTASQAGITAIVQPGGAKRDQTIIDAANAANIMMVFTGQRHFKH
jgi:phosphoribosylaminoimidazolecarboxamide formyltransferase / IMP cyclohydrolase